MKIGSGIEQKKYSNEKKTFVPSSSGGSVYFMTGSHSEYGAQRDCSQL